MIERSYPTELFVGISMLIAEIQIDGAPAFTFRDPDTGGPYQAAEPRPIYATTNPLQTGECVIVTPRTPQNGPNTTVQFDVQVYYMGPRDGKFLAAQDVASIIAGRFMTNGRPLSHVRAGNLRLGQIWPTAVNAVGRDGEKRQCFSINLRTRGKRFAV